MFFFSPLHKGKKKAEKKKQKVQRKVWFMNEVSLIGHYFVFPQAEDYMCFSFCTHTGCLAPSPRAPQLFLVLWLPCSPGATTKTALETPLKGRYCDMERTQERIAATEWVSFLDHLFRSWNERENVSVMLWSAKHGSTGWHNQKSKIRIIWIASFILIVSLEAKLN